jgi:ferritin-like metal-binding protein YciE
MKLDSLKKLLVHELKDLYSAEKQLIKALPKMAKAATHDELRQAFEDHLEETEEHAERLEQVFEMLGASARTEKCKAMQGLIEEAQDLMKEDAEPDVMDAALIASAQRVEHYEIAGYGCARTYAELLGEDEAAALLQKTLDEEGATDHKLTEIAESAINLEAAAA